MGSIVAWQLAVALSLAVSRVFSSKAMIGVAVIWTALTFLMVWANWLIALQLVTAWGSVGLLMVVFGERPSIASKSGSAGNMQLQVNGSVAAESATVDLPSPLTVAPDAAGAVTTKEANATETRSVTATIASLLTGARAVETSNTMIQGFNKAMGDINDGLQIQIDKVEANREISMQLLLRMRREAIQSYAREIAIPHLVHFTRCENLPGILDRGLMSISTCSKEGVAFVRNDSDRRDGQPNGISLSIAFPNYLMFYKYRMQTGADWAVLLISPSVLWEKDCAFYSHNAADARVSREPLDKMKSLQAFRDMFVEESGAREPSLRGFDPSDPQAEILVFETVPSAYIEAVAFENREARARYMHLMGGIESFYAGTGKGLFGSRSKARVN
ncbi:DarT ssDNA thymidine ADP-ribosyltransferase family protein [Rhizobium leguminosarum]|uniref:DarT ssDNA thymidine ADP-ribosyltransferase family protein n=1 Tax=Rhizobium leguminosarum TaxID=384 RepID=UPI001A91B033|nr:DarT ssDNA thymidine ADP-ribosyltransferase family protein [Rhizobium leguminosarum]MBY5554134.1 DUF4433 domain-containing protein [Rhizobium leguminosarum]MBY5723560.1 DUF4433 domain-containing protein [Rhizobium leguminosarum]QSW27253.1 DUF4433 domain-containing protein [Rhizobium leguminosarum]